MSHPPGPHTPRTQWVQVWPLWQRVLHMGLAAAVLIALFTHEGGRMHEAAGYVALACAVLRILMGFAGPTVTRFSSFVHGARVTWAYAQQLLHGVEPRHINHNPLGAWMVLALLVVILIGAASGALYATDRYWGDATLIAIHAASCWALLPLVVLHWVGVAHASWRHRENLAAAMWDGRKAATDDAPHAARASSDQPG